MADQQDGGQDLGGHGSAVSSGAAARLAELNAQPTLSPRPWELIFDRGPARHFDGTPAAGTAPIVNSFRIVDADNRLLVRIQADREQALKIEDMQLIVAAVNAQAETVRLAARLELLDHYRHARNDALDALRALSSAATVVWHQASVGDGRVDLDALNALADAQASARALTTESAEPTTPSTEPVS